jgi:peptide/nickel transport system ATP-binding protein/oligopeptide transport system ATP-binding protein
MNNHLLEIRNLSISFDIEEGKANAVHDICFSIDSGEVVGLVGESGSGKSVTALSIMRLIAMPPGRIDQGRILFRPRNLLLTGRDGIDLLREDIKTLRAIRGKDISIVFQEPMACLSPLKRIGQQMIETLRLHLDITVNDARAFSEEWLQKVGISGTSERMSAYPYQLSGGMQQRIMIAMAMMLKPDLLIADEPTTALDVTTQHQIFELLRDMKKRIRSAILLITHDMGVVWEMCDRVLVMYAGCIVEEGARDDIFFKPLHPYTRGLLQSIPRLTGEGGRLKAIAGQVPSPLHYPAGCRFQDRCPYAIARCKDQRPLLRELAENHRVACFLAEQFV